MSRRTLRSEHGFESDSFLDIIANIVGILIILIVMAGVRVSNAPIVPQLEITSSKADSDPPNIAVVGSTESEQPPVPSVPGSESSPPPIEPPPKPSPELVAYLDRMNKELAELDARSLSAKSSLQQIAAAERQANERLQKLGASLSTEVSALDEQKREMDRLQSELDRRRGQVQQIRFQLARAEEQRSPAKQIRHKLTPVGRTVDGTEIHFHLARNRVAFVPLEELLARLRGQIVRQKDWLTKFHSHQGSVGPVGGFTMNYVVVRQRLSVVEELRQGRGLMRIGVSEWQLIPEADQAAESAAEALRPGSAFHRALLSVDADATLTFWVYPDSYSIYQTLKQVAHEEGFTVAARPLPFGIPISGSPNGTRSSGQ